MGLGPAGFQYFEESGVVDKAGQAVVIYGFDAVSGATAGEITIHDGSDENGNVIFQDKAAVVSTGYHGNLLSKGVLFPNGAHVTLDSNIVSCAVFYTRYPD